MKVCLWRLFVLDDFILYFFLPLPKAFTSHLQWKMTSWIYLHSVQLSIFSVFHVSASIYCTELPMSMELISIYIVHRFWCELNLLWESSFGTGTEYLFVHFHFSCVSHLLVGPISRSVAIFSMWFLRFSTAIKVINYLKRATLFRSPWTAYAYAKRLLLMLYNCLTVCLVYCIRNELRVSALSLVPDTWVFLSVSSVGVYVVISMINCMFWLKSTVKLKWVISFYDDHLNA